MNDASVCRDAVDGRSIFAEGYVSFETGLHPDHRADEEGDYSIVGNDKADVPFLPRPPGERDCEKIDTKDGQPDLKPGGFVNVSLCDLCVEIGLRERRDRAGDGDRRQEDERKLKRSKIVNQPPYCRTLAAFGDHLLVSGCGCDGRAHGLFTGRAYIP